MRWMSFGTECLAGHGAHPPKQIAMLAGKKFENSSTHDLAQHISA